MNQDISKLSPTGKSIYLKSSSAQIGPILNILREAFDHQGGIAIENFEIDNKLSIPEKLVLHGRIMLFNVNTEAQVEFQWKNDTLISLCILAKPPKNWNLLHSFPHLNQLKGIPQTLLGMMNLKNPSFVLTTNYSPIISSEFDLDQEIFSPGVNIFSPSLDVPNEILHLHLNARFGEFGKLPGNKCLVKGLLSRISKKRELQLQFWWREETPKSIGDMKLLSSALEFHIEVDDSSLAVPYSNWIWELEFHKNEVPIFLSAFLTEDQTEPLIFEYRNRFTRPLQGGITSLKTMVNSVDSVKESFSNSNSEAEPSVKISWLSYCPGKWLLVRLLLVDDQTGKPYQMKINDLITIDMAELTLNSNYTPTKSMTMAIAGVIDIDGFRFAADYYPGNLIRGVLLDPINLDLETFLTHALGQPFGLPHTNLKLIQAEYSRELNGSGTDYFLMLGGHIDFLGNGKFLLESVGCSVSRLDGVTTEIALTGTFKVAEKTISVLGVHSKERGWEFSGTADIDWTVSLHDMVEHLTQVWGAEAPPGIPDIQLKQIGLTFGAKTASFGLMTRAEFKVPSFFPLGGSEVNVLLDVHTEKLKTSAKRDTHIEIRWQQTAGEKEFLAEASYDADGENLFMSWDGGDKEVFGLKEIYNALHLDSFFVLPVGSEWSIFEFHRISMSFASTPQVMNLSGESTFGSGLLEMEASLSEENRSFSGTWKPKNKKSTIGLNNLLELIGLGDEIALAKSIGSDIFTFNNLSLRYECNTSPSLQFIGESGKGSSHADMFFVAQKQPTWGFIVGTTISEHSGLTKIPGFEEACKLLSIQPKYLCVSSLEDAHFMPPIAAPELNVGQDKAPKMPGAFGKTNPTAKSTFKLYKGATVAADILFTESDNAAMKIVHELIGIDKLAGTISLGADNFSLTALIPGQVNISTGSGSDLVLSEAYFGMSIVGPETTFQIAGSSTFHLFGKTREIEVKLAVDEAAAVANVHLRDIPLPSPPPLPGVIMKEECWLEVGAQFEPPDLDLGFMGSFYIGDNPEEYAGEAVFVMELIEGVPNPLYVKFSINRLDLWAMFEAMTGMMHRIDQVEDLVNEGSDTESGLEFLKHMYQNLKSVLKLVALENVSFHWSDSIVILPDGSTAMPGVGFRGTLDLFGWKTFAAFEFSVAVPTQLSARFEMHSIHLNHVLSITGDGQGVLKREATGEEPWDKWKHSSKWVEKGAKIRTKTGENPVGLTKVVPTSGAEYIIPPGGPVFIVSSHHSPFLHADMKVALFDLLHAEVKADVDMNGLSFEIKTGIGGISELDLTCKIGTHGSTHFEASGRFSVHLNVNIPIDLPLIPKFNIPLSAGLDAEIDLRITDSEFDCVIQGSFEFEGVELHMPKIELDVPFDSFSKLPEIIIIQIISNADEIFADVADLLEDLAKIAAKEVEKVGDEVADGAKAIGDGAVKLEEAIGKGADEAFNAAEHEVDAAANKLTQAADDIVDSTLGQMGVIGEVAGVAVKELLNDAKVVMDKAIEAAAAVSHEVIKDIEAITHAIADVAAFAAHAVAKIAADVAIAVQAVFDVARKAAHEIMKAAKAVVEGLKDAAKAVWNTIAEVGKKLADIAKAVLRGIEDAARAISSALASIFHGW